MSKRHLVYTDDLTKVALRKAVHRIFQQAQKVFFQIAKKHFGNKKKLFGSNFAESMLKTKVTVINFCMTLCACLICSVESPKTWFKKIHKISSYLSKFRCFELKAAIPEYQSLRFQPA